jgi:hypothetical protein
MPVPSDEREAAPSSILVFDGIFLHRPELLGYWDASIDNNDLSAPALMANADRVCQTTGRE